MRMMRSGKQANMRYTITAVLLVLMQCAPGLASAQGPEKNDGKLLSDMMATNTYELGLMKVIMGKAQKPELKEAANTMLIDFQRWDAELTSLANRMNVSMPDEVQGRNNEKIAGWTRVQSGNRLDKDLVDELVNVHLRTVDMLQNAKGMTGNDQLKALTQQMIPAYQSHLDILVPMQNSMRDKGTAAPDTRVEANITKAKKDDKFLSDMVNANRYELGLLQLILKKSGNRDLKNAAQKMLSDHQMLADRAAAYSTAKGYKVDPDKMGKYNEKLQKWSGKKGGMEWDADMVTELVDMHKDGIDMLEDSRKDVQDEELRTIIEEALHPMRMHLTMLEPLKGQVKKPWKQTK